MTTEKFRRIALLLLASVAVGQPINTVSENGITQSINCNGKISVCVGPLNYKKCEKNDEGNTFASGAVIHCPENHRCVNDAVDICVPVKSTLTGSEAAVLSSITSTDGPPPHKSTYESAQDTTLASDYTITPMQNTLGTGEETTIIIREMPKILLYATNATTWATFSSEYPTETTTVYSEMPIDTTVAPTGDITETIITTIEEVPMEITTIYSETRIDTGVALVGSATETVVTTIEPYISSDKDTEKTTFVDHITTVPPQVPIYPSTGHSGSVVTDIPSDPNTTLDTFSSSGDVHAAENLDMTDQPNVLFDPNDHIATTDPKTQIDLSALDSTNDPKGSNFLIINSTSMDPNELIDTNAPTDLNEFIEPHIKTNSATNEIYHNSSIDTNSPIDTNSLINPKTEISTNTANRNPNVPVNLKQTDLLEASSLIIFNSPAKESRPVSPETVAQNAYVNPNALINLNTSVNSNILVQSHIRKYSTSPIDPNTQVTMNALDNSNVPTVNITLVVPTNSPMNPNVSITNNTSMDPIASVDMNTSAVRKTKAPINPKTPTNLQTPMYHIGLVETNAQIATNSPTNPIGEVNTNTLVDAGVETRYANLEPNVVDFKEQVDPLEVNTLVASNSPAPIEEEDITFEGPKLPTHSSTETNMNGPIQLNYSVSSNVPMASDTPMNLKSAADLKESVYEIEPIIPNSPADPTSTLLSEQNKNPDGLLKSNTVIVERHPQVDQKAHYASMNPRALIPTTPVPLLKNPNSYVHLNTSVDTYKSMETNFPDEPASLNVSIDPNAFTDANVPVMPVAIINPSSPISTKASVEPNLTQKVYIAPFASGNLNVPIYPNNSIDSNAPVESNVPINMISLSNVNTPASVKSSAEPDTSFDSKVTVNSISPIESQAPISANVSVHPKAVVNPGRLVYSNAPADSNYVITGNAPRNTSESTSIPDNPNSPNIVGHVNTNENTAILSAEKVPVDRSTPYELRVTNAAVNAPSTNDLNGPHASVPVIPNSSSPGSPNAPVDIVSEYQNMPRVPIEPTISSEIDYEGHPIWTRPIRNDTSSQSTVNSEWNNNKKLRERNEHHSQSHVRYGILSWASHNDSSSQETKETESSKVMLPVKLSKPLSKESSSFEEELRLNSKKTKKNEESKETGDKNDDKKDDEDDEDDDENSSNEKKELIKKIIKEIKEKKCEEDDIYPDPRDCKKFYRCVHKSHQNKILHLRCESGERFDAKKRKCVSKRKAKCFSKEDFLDQFS